MPRTRRKAAGATAAAASPAAPRRVTRSQTKAMRQQQEQDPAASSSSPANWNELNPKTEHYEFGGPIGAFAMVTVLPALVVAFAFGCDASGFDPIERAYRFLSDLINGNFTWDILLSLITSWKPSALFWYTSFIAQLVGFAVAMPGDTVQGTKMRDGSRLTYKLNGLQSAQTLFMVSMMANRGLGYRSPLWVYDNFAHLAVASIVVAYAVAFAVYIASFTGKPRLLALGGNTGNAIYDFMVGRELNPRIGQFDIKFFTELRPGLLGWMAINVCMGIKQYVSLGRVTNSMVLVQAFQALYVLDALYNESSILTTMDITTDGFGFMLAFGNLCWVPMMYSLQARYLADFPVDLPIPALVGILVLQCLGYYIFRSANSQKDRFRQDPNDPAVRDIKYIETSKGTKLITSGWWGKARHINYLGDWLMSVAWCLPCGFGSVIPYFYCIYFGILLIHRERRDDDKCKKKYGKDWDKYCSIVKYRIIPGIY